MDAIAIIIIIRSRSGRWDRAQDGDDFFLGAVIHLLFLNALLQRWVFHWEMHRKGSNRELYINPFYVFFAPLAIP